MAGYTFEDMLQGLVNSYKEIPRENKKKNFSPNRENDVIYLRAMDKNCPTDIIIQIASRIDKDKLWGEDITTISLAISSVEEKDVSLTVIMYSILDYLKSCGCSVEEIKETYRHQGKGQCPADHMICRFLFLPFFTCICAPLIKN